MMWTCLGLPPESVNSSQEWLQRWLQALHGAPLQCQVPPAASAITTPLVPSAWRTMLISHPQPPLVHFLPAWDQYWLLDRLYSTIRSPQISQDNEIGVQPCNS